MKVVSWDEKVLSGCKFVGTKQKVSNKRISKPGTSSARRYLQLSLQQWGAGNIHLLVLSSWKVNIVQNPIADSR